MTIDQPPSASPYQHAIDPTIFSGYTVLGEPLDVLVSFVLRIQFEKTEDDMATFSGRWPHHEADAFLRAMTRVEPEMLDDARTPGQRDVDRLVAAVLTVGRAMHGMRMFDRLAP